jgi:hypothetical protein
LSPHRRTTGWPETSTGFFAANRSSRKKSSNVSTSSTRMKYASRSPFDLGVTPTTQSPGAAVERILGLQQASVHHPWNGFGANPVS